MASSAHRENILALLTNLSANSSPKEAQEKLPTGGIGRTGWSNDPTTRAGLERTRTGGRLSSGGCVNPSDLSSLFCSASGTRVLSFAGKSIATGISPGPIAGRSEGDMEG
jgi:hypothetical protein